MKKKTNSIAFKRTWTPTVCTPIMPRAWAIRVKWTSFSFQQSFREETVMFLFWIQCVLLSDHSTCRHVHIVTCTCHLVCKGSFTLSLFSSTPACLFFPAHNAQPIMLKLVTSVCDCYRVSCFLLFSREEANAVCFLRASRVAPVLSDQTLFAAERSVKLDYPGAWLLSK